LLWASSTVAILVLWSGQLFDWRMASRIVTAAADVLFVGMMVFLPKHSEGLS